MKLITHAHNYCITCRAHDSSCDCPEALLSKSFTKVYSKRTDVFDNAVKHTILGVKYIYAKEGKIIGKPSRKALRIFNDGRMSAVVDGKAVNNWKELLTFFRQFDCPVDGFHDLISGILGKTGGNNRSSDMLDLYYKSRNSLLKDLGLTSTAAFFGTIKGNERAKVYYHTKKHGSKAGRAVLAGCKTKKLQKIVIDNLGCRDSVIEMIKLYSVTEDQIVHRVNACEEHTSAWDNAGSFVKSMHYTLRLGFSIKVAMNVPHSVGMSCRDTLTMLGELYAHDPSYVAEITTPREMHDKVTRDYRRMQSGLNAAMMLTVLPEHRHPDMGLSGCTIESAKTIGDLIECGNELNICVGSYWRRVLEGMREIYFVRQNGMFVACLEVTGDNLVQAKLRFNKEVQYVPEMKSIVEEWASIMDIYINTNDMGDEIEIRRILPFANPPLAQRPPFVPIQFPRLDVPEVPPAVQHDDLDNDLPF